LASAMVLIGFLLVVFRIQWRSTAGYILIVLTSMMVLFFMLSFFSIRWQNKCRNKHINRLSNKLAELAFQLKISRISLSLGFVALIIGSLQLGYPWGLRIAASLVFIVDGFLFWPYLRKLGKLSRQAVYRVLWRGRLDGS